MLRSLIRFNRVSVFRLHSCMNFSSNSESMLHVEPCDFKIQKCSSLLRDYGFNPGQINRILQSPHTVLSFSDKDVVSNLMCWLKFDVREKLFTALCAYPELLTLNPDFIENRMKELMTLFTKKDINKLLVTCPRVFLDDFTSVFEKVQYMVHRMGAEQKSIVKTRALQFDLNHIRCRHMFMIHSGKYIPTKKDVKSKNPPLNKIFSRNIETFLKLTQLTEEEFLVFCRCFEDGYLELPEDEEIDEED